MYSKPGSNDRSARNLRNSGFTLIEVMIVVAILAIVAAIGYPSYTDYMQKTRRVDAITLLSEVAGEQQRFFTENNRYADKMTEMGYPTDAVLSENDYYTVTVSAQTTTSFTISAVPVAGAAQDSDGKCGTFTINSAGVKGVENASNSAEDCW